MKWGKLFYRPQMLLSFDVGGSQWSANLIDFKMSLSISHKMVVVKHRGGRGITVLEG